MQTGRGRFWFAAALLFPSLIIFNSGPLPSLYNQALALILWGGAIAFAFGRARKSALNVFQATWTQLAAITILALSVVGSMGATQFPHGAAACVLAFLASAVVVSGASGKAFSQVAFAPIDWSSTFITAVALSAIANCGPAVVQIFAPDAIDRIWLEIAWSPDRISGNVRQPNLLATSLSWGIAALVAISELRRVPQWVQRPASCLMLLVIAATGSRVGALEVVALAIWGGIDQRLCRANRVNLLLAPAVMGIAWLGLRYWASLSGVDHGRAPDLTSGRYAMWRQCLSLISTHPWLGVGLGNFNFAWTLTPFDRSNPETFDHAHNLILQWAVELGIPITLLLIGLFGQSLWLCVQRTRKTTGDESIVRRFCLVMIALVLIHSMTEYPLWYAYFLLPTAFAWGIAAAPPTKMAEPSVDGGKNAPTFNNARPETNWLGTCGLLMALGAAFAVYDYQKIVTVYHPWDGAPPIEERVAAGRKAVLYGYLADRFAGTLAVNGARTLEPYKEATRRLLDMRLLIAWSLAMRENGDVDKARYLAQRVKDFDDPVAKQFFRGCEPAARMETLPWQCTPPVGHYTYEDFL